MAAEALQASAGAGEDEGRMQYPNKLELMLTLVGWAVGLGNVWRFPYLAYTYGGGAFLIPYFCALLVLGLPLFVLELGLGQMLRQGTLGVWDKLGLPRFRGVGAAATITTYLVSLYYNVILAWTIYYLGRTLGGIFSGGALPWDDQMPGFVCPQSLLIARTEVANSSFLVDQKTGLFNRSHVADFWCPGKGLPSLSMTVPEGYQQVMTSPSSCPAEAASQFWSKQALQQSSGMDDLGGFHWGMLLSHTVAWLLVYICIFKGIASSGKVVYVTATLPYIVLVIFFFRAVTLPNAMTGVAFYLKPDFSLLLNTEVWLRAVTQIFYSLGVGFGSLIAFASYGNRKSDFVRDAVNVSVINCMTSFFAGFVVFPILGFLALEMSEVNPCFNSNNLEELSSVGLSGTGLAFIAFPIAVSQMPLGAVWALLFFIMLLCLGIDSEFAMVESVITVLNDAGIGKRWPRPVFTGGICFVSYLLGLIFCTRGGIYWFNLFDYYSCVVSMFFVTCLQCCGLMWYKRAVWMGFKARVEEWTGRRLGLGFVFSWRVVCPVLTAFLIGLSLTDGDLMNAAESVPYPEGSGFYPEWSIYVGWCLGLLPVLGFLYFLIFGGRRSGVEAFGAAGGDEAEKEAEEEEEEADTTRFEASYAGQASHGHVEYPSAEKEPVQSAVDHEVLDPRDIKFNVDPRDGDEAAGDFKVDKDVQPVRLSEALGAQPQRYGKDSGEQLGPRKKRSAKKEKQRPACDDAVPVYGFLCGVFLKKGLRPAK